MKALLKTGEVFGFEYRDIPKPVLKEDEVLIKVYAAAICGTDIHLHRWDQSAVNFASNFDVKFPFMVGHEFSGVIEAVGSGVKEKKVGDRVSIETHIPCGKCYQCQTDNAHNCLDMGAYGVSCDGCFGDYAIAKESVVFKLTDEISFEEGALFEPAGVAMRAVEESCILPGDTVAVLGCGPIGLIAIQILNTCGAARIIAVDIDDYRLEMAKKYGVITINPEKQDAAAIIKDLTKTRGGVDVVLEMTGSAQVYPLMFDILRLEGHIVTIGHPAGEIPINVTKNINLKGAAIKGLFGRRIWGTWWKLASLVGAKKINILDVVTHRYPLEKYEEAFEQIGKRTGKILFINEWNEKNQSV